MTVVLPAHARQALVTLIVVACGACGGGDAALQLDFRLPEGPRVFDAASRVELVASQNDRRIAFETAPYSSGVSLALSDVATTDDLELTVTARDAAMNPLAYGVLGPSVTASIAKLDARCCLTMCLCSLAYHQGDTDGDGDVDSSSGDPCDCGSTACTACN